MTIIDLLLLSSTAKDLSACCFSTICCSQDALHVSFLCLGEKTFAIDQNRKIVWASAVLALCFLLSTGYMSSDYKYEIASQTTCEMAFCLTVPFQVM